MITGFISMRSLIRGDIVMGYLILDVGWPVCQNLGLGAKTLFLHILTLTAGYLRSIDSYGYEV